MAQSKSGRLSEEQQLNDMFVVLEYSDSFKELIEGINEQTRLRLFDEIKKYYGD